MYQAVTCHASRIRMIRGFAALCAAVVLMTASCKTDKECRESCFCSLRGACAAKGNECKATEKEHCLESQVCATMGHCTPQDGKCVAASDTDCQRSELCTKAGRCTMKAGRCTR
ncbi:MAG: hypothetical protein HOW73_19845 [Polyangiaceae bacterium]|nr:hypothetical protein [Polyangiaceae bacterium]